MYYVYRFLNKEGQIIYVGKTSNLQKRMYRHFGSHGHLDEECYKEAVQVEYIEINKKADMALKEIFYINKWQPKYNKQSKYDDGLSLNLQEKSDIWTRYRDKYTQSRSTDETDEYLTEINPLNILRNDLDFKKQLELKKLRERAPKELLDWLNTEGKSIILSGVNEKEVLILGDYILKLLCGTITKEDREKLLIYDEDLLDLIDTKFADYVFKQEERPSITQSKMVKQELSRQLIQSTKATTQNSSVKEIVTPFSKSKKTKGKLSDVIIVNCKTFQLEDVDI